MVNTGLPPGCYDNDEVLLHAAMAVLGRHIEDRGGIAKLQAFTDELRAHPNQYHPELTNSQADHQQEAIDIWTWWTVTRPAQYARISELWRINADTGDIEKKRDAIDESNTLDVEVEEADQKMLHRLVDIRQTLWT